MRSTFIHLITLTALTTTAHALPQAPAIQLTDAVAEPTTAGGTTRISARILNNTSHTVTVSAIGSPLARSARLLVYGKDDLGLATVTEADALTLPPGETLLLPNVFELRLTEVIADLTPGNEIPLGFKFANNTGRTFKVLIKE